MKFNIIIDSVSLLSSLTGIGKYTNEVAKSLEKDDSFTLNYFYGFYSKKRITPKKSAEIKSLKAFVSDRPLLKKITRSLLLYVSNLFSPKFDLYWQPNFIPLRGIKASVVVTTVHDFSFYIHPEWHPKERLDYYNQFFYKNIKRSDWIITGSEFSKNEIIEYLKFDAEKITVIYHGVDHDLYKVYDQTILNITKNKHNLNDNFLLFVGSIEPRKNLLNLLKAYHLLPGDIKEKYPLIIVGFKGWENQEIMNAIDKEKKHIRYLGYLSDEELAHVYNIATLFIYPSLYEGFGIPPLEAMASGTPVICSDVSSLPEVGGNAVVYCDPYNIEDMKNKIEKVLLDVNLKSMMTQRGLERVKEFSWEKSAVMHANIFKKLLKQ